MVTGDVQELYEGDTYEERCEIIDSFIDDHVSVYKSKAELAKTMYFASDQEYDAFMSS